MALHTASPWATHAQASLLETITVMSADVIEQALITIPLLGKNLDEFRIAADPELSRLLLRAITEFTRAIEISAPGADGLVRATP